MSETKWTPGPWTPNDYRIFKLRPDGLYEKHIAWTANNARTRTPQALADARLIAAAPDLYQALSDIMSGVAVAGGDAEFIQAVAKANKALALARGESPDQTPRSEDERPTVSAKRL